MYNKIVLLTILSIVMVLATPTVLAQYPANAVYFEPESINETVPYANIMVNTSIDTMSVGIDIYFDPSCVNITDVDFTGTPYSETIGWTYWGDHVRVGAMNFMSAVSPGTHVVAELTFECVGGGDCVSDIEFTATELTDDNFDKIDDASWINGTFTCGTPPSTTAGVVINEFVSDNSTEWVELYNAGAESVDLTGWTLKDDDNNPKTLSETIPADGYVVFTNSRWLNNDGDTIYLNDTGGNSIDMVAYGDHGDAPNPGAGKSAGRDPNGEGDFRIFDTPTPGAANVLPTSSGTITSCDSSGAEKDQFAPGENVYVEGSGLAPNTKYVVWIQNSGSVVEGKELNASEDPSGSQEAVETDASGNLPQTEIWAISQDEDVTHTEYDIVVDDGDGTYNAASDYIDSATTAGIVAPIPELPTFILTGIGILGLVLLAQRRE